jgi:uncharacterized protein (AIM24 family)
VVEAARALRRDAVFTVKLIRGEAVKIVSGASVEVSGDNNCHEIAVTGMTGEVVRYTVGREGYSMAYVENANGKTTHVVRMG